MRFISRLFGQKPPEPPAPHTQLHSQLPAKVANVNSSTRRELLRVVLRETLTRHGIPLTWIGAELLAAASRSREPGIHLRLLMRHWDPRLLPCMVALQKHLLHRVELYDPLAPNWLMGISWQFALDDESVCPELPPPAAWRAGPVVAAPAAATPAAAAAPIKAVAPAPVDRRAELDRLLAQHDRKPKPWQTGAPEPDFGVTQPMYRPTQPAEP